MSIFRIELPDDYAGPRVADGLLISAEDATDAEEMAKAYFGETSAAALAAGSPTAEADVAVADANALVDWTFQIVVSDTSNAEVANVTVTGDGTNDTLDEIGTALATALNATASIANAAYTAGTQTLVVASGSGGDDLGDHSVVVNVRPPAATGSGVGKTNIAGFVASVTDEGASTAALTVVFGADTLVVPRILKAYNNAKG